ncbi:MAG TPA: ribosome recycling factor [Acidimicrobiales bacterium]|nr:ribosome recycling factor [Acidimicrobiales bacterium]
MDEELTAVVLADAREKMDKAVAHTRSEFAGVRSGRASAGLVEHLKVDVYGTAVELRTLAGLSVPEARLLVVAPYDKTTLGSIEKAIQLSDLGITPSNDGTVIRLAFPPLTEERRRDLVKLVRHKAEEGRVAIRNVRRTARHDLEALEHDGDLSSDELERIEKDLEKLTHEMVASVEKLLTHKEQELLEI